MYAFGFEILDNANTDNESLSVYDTDSALLGTLYLSRKASLSSTRQGLVGALPTGASAVESPSLSPSSFIGVMSDVPIGFASFDESVDEDAIGLAGFVFGYKEYEQALFPPNAWLLFGLPLVCIAVFEHRVLSSLPKMDLTTASAWLLLWSFLAALASVALWALRSWRQATLYSVCFSLNGMLSGDNLFVFMLLLQQSRLNERYHVLAVSHGMILALGARILLSLAGAALLQRFSWLMLLFAAILLASGIKLLCFEEGAGDAARGSFDNSCEKGASGAAANGSGSGGGEIAQRCVGACLPVVWSEDTEDRYFVRDERGHLCATRMTLCVCAICISDVLFAMDSVPVVLSLTTSPFLLVSSQVVSLLWLRPVYFLLAALARYLDSMQQTLAVVLILIALKIFLEAAGFEIPISLFLGVLVGWRILAITLQLLRHHGAAAH